MIISVLVIAVLIGRAAYLQIYQGEYYAGLADGNRIRIVPSMAPRGTFYDRNGELLVTNRPGFSVSLLPLTAPISHLVDSPRHRPIGDEARSGGERCPSSWSAT